MDTAQHSHFPVWAGMSESWVFQGLLGSSGTFPGKTQGSLSCPPETDETGRLRTNPELGHNWGGEAALTGTLALTLLSSAHQEELSDLN